MFVQKIKILGAVVLGKSLTQVSLYIKLERDGKKGKEKNEK